MDYVIYPDLINYSLAGEINLIYLLRWGEGDTEDEKWTIFYGEDKF